MIGWIDASSGASGDMLLAALIDAGADEAFLRDAVAAVAPEATSLSKERVRRGALTGLRVHVEITDSMTHRGLSDVLDLISRAGLDDRVSQHAVAVFTRLGEVEAKVHGISTDQVHFHEVGALDAIADIVGVCAGFVSLGLTTVQASPVAVGSGTIQTAHGQLSVPPPAVVELLRGIPSYAGPAASELCTPTGAALLSHWVSAWGTQPPMTVEQVGVGAGGKDFEGHANVVRLFVGAELDQQSGEVRPDALVYETNVDDIDPRLWPPILQRLLDAGASDAWLTPILMKKGRPAHTLSVLLRPELATEVRTVIFAETSAIGLRETRVHKHALAREFVTIEVDGLPISIKVARDAGQVVSVQPEYDDVVAAASRLGHPVKRVLAQTVAASAYLWETA